MEDIPIRNVTDNRGTPVIREMGSISHRDVELCRIGGPQLEVFIKLV